MSIQSGSLHAALGTPAPEWTEFYAKHQDLVPELKGTPQQMREIIAKLKTRLKSIVPQIEQGYTVRDVNIPAADGASVGMRIYTPTSDSKTFPAIYYIHGGGFTIGDLNGEDGICRLMCTRIQAVIVSVDYRLAPEHPFPTGLDDAWAGFKWTIANASDLHVDPSRVLMSGSSSGGNFVAALAHRARDDKIPLKGQVLGIPVTCHPSAHPLELNLHSLEECKDAPLLSKRSMEFFWDYYNPPDPKARDASPLLADSFKGLAPAYVQISGMDPLRDEGLAYVDKMKDAGVPVKLDIYPGLPHAFGFYPELPQAAKNGADLLAGIESLLS